MRLAVLVTIAILFAGARPADAEMFVSAGAGVFDPWEGSPGHEVDASVLTTLGQKIRSVRIGGEFAYRSAEGEILKVHNVDFESYRVSFVAHYRPLLDWFIEPYIGGRLTVAYNDVDGGRIERVTGRGVNTSNMIGFGGAGLAGFDLPIGKHFALYGEVSLGADLLLIDAHHSDDNTDSENWLDLDSLEPHYSSENVGGLTGTAGLRVRF